MAIHRIAKAGPMLAQLEQISPVKFSHSPPNTEEIIDELFPDNPLLCVAKTKTAAVTRYRDEFRGRLMEVAFVHNLNPMEKEVTFAYVDNQPKAGESYYYVRVIQANDQMAWSSPIWVRR